MELLVARKFDFYSYADESGLHGSPLYCIMAGYVGEAKPWNRFEGRWDRILAKNDVMDFHAKDYFARSPDGRRVGKFVRRSTGRKVSYGNWPEHQHSAFLQGLLKIARQEEIQPVGIALELAAWNELVYGERKFLTGGTHWRRG
jgi:hypothetical protein